MPEELTPEATIDLLRQQARDAHLALVIAAADGLNWATDGTLQSGVRHAVEMIDRLRADNTRLQAALDRVPDTIVDARGLQSLEARLVIIDPSGKGYQKQTDGTFLDAGQRTEPRTAADLARYGPFTVLVPAPRIIATGGVEAVIDEVTASVGYGLLPTHERNDWARRVATVLGLFDGGMGNFTADQRARAQAALVDALGDSDRAAFLSDVVLDALADPGNDEERYQALRLTHPTL